MKKLNALALLVCFTLSLVAQNAMHVKKFNSTSFREDVKVTPPLLVSNTTAAAQQHPEFGLLPYNSQCATCVELIDKRTIDSRQFIDPLNAGHTYSQQSYFPLHYKKSANDVWRTIDQRLRPVAPGVYEANNQPVPTKCDLNKKSTSLTEHGFEFEFNKNLTMYFFDDATLYTRSEPGNYNTYTVGEEGLTVKNIWPGMDMEQQFTAGQIKTSYVIAAPLQIPIASGYMVIEDHFTLPDGYSFVESELGHHLENDKYQGDYHLKNSKGETLITYEKPIYIDAKAWGMHGSYKLIRTGNDYTLQTLVPVSWLNKADNTYPIIIDPIVYGSTKNGDFTSTGLPSSSMGFTTMSLGSCPYHMNVFLQGKSQIINTYVDIEYSLTYDNTCGSPPLPSPFCTFSQVSMEVKSDECNTSTGPLTCNAASPPYTGTCTTDSNLVPGANATQFSGLLPGTCIPPQCPDYTLHFTLLNRDSTCGDVCGYLCARGNMWRITVEGERVEGNITQNKTQVCAGQPVTFTAHPNFGVPPYHYIWIYANGDSFDTIYGSPDLVLNPNISQGVQCVIIDTCGVTANTNALDVTVFPSPYITLSGDTLTCSAALSYQWYLNNNIITGATSQTYVPGQPGLYSVQVNDIHGCNSTSANYAYQISGATNLKDNPAISLYPNPANNELTIVTNGKPVEQVKIYAADGSLVLDSKPAGFKLDISLLPTGNYIAEIKVKEGAKKVRFAKL